MEAIIIAILVGIGVGIVVGALGAGGGILAVPALIYLLGQSPHGAATGSLVIVLATALTALPGRIRKGNVRFKDGLVFAFVSMVGSFLGAKVAGQVSGDILLTAFAIMITIMGIIMLRKGLLEAKRYKETQAGLVAAAEEKLFRRGLPAIALAALFTGFLTGFFGVGGGFIVVPMLTLVLGFNIREAAGTSLLIMILAAASGLLSRWGQPVVVDWWVVFAFMAGSMSGSFIGGPLSQKAKPHMLTLIFAALLGAVGVVTAVALTLS
ncbi:hypothetical protein HMPREF0044_0191 [Gleimia coleocanis DSM 15436]|uniref:Probable membrane transporter protein n=1 Tax=Gleimia coleocanis DSM 15436 TaxID=525245 RepID=C0VYF1_9ACTO|nr:sulfite exporter TauE/SafE family protein [Gleimia coleocanis]EEH64454.1 hypothetical protein HMPREF0044_0191 [Gleimia coleocanis DSM 15436]